MVVSCAAYNCTESKQKGSSSDVSFHRFPLRNPEQLKKWIHEMKRKDFVPNQHSRICSKHFELSCFVVRPGKQGRRLYDHAVPTIFDFDKPYFQKTKPKRKAPKKREFVEPVAEVIDDDVQPSPSKVAKVVESDHSYKKTQDPEHVDQQNNKEIKRLRHKVKLLGQKLQRKKKRVKNMTGLLKSLKEKQLVEQEQHSLLKNNFGGMVNELFKNEQRNAAKSTHGRRYSEETKQFAVTLHYYSPKAYEFVRKMFSLPHSTSIKTWASSIDCEPGYLTNVIDVLRSAIQNKPWMSDMVLIVDAMALHKGTIWDPKMKRYVGTVDYGTAIPEPPDNLATEALVFMVSSMTGHFKHPIAYVLQDKCTAVVQAQLIKDCICLLHEAGANILALVFDGCFTNQSTAKKLGCKMKVSDIQPWFPHPQVSDAKIHVIFDICHMIKLMRNLFGDYKEIYTEKNGCLQPIKWKFIEDLNTLQEDLGFQLANKLKKKHIMWTKHKMNVRLAAQTLSASVTNAIDFLRDEVGLDEFKNSEATTDFIRKVDTLFDLLNSRNPLAKGSKAPVSLQNIQSWASTCESTANYIFNLKDERNNLLRAGRRKTVLWGFVFSVKSIASVAAELINCRNRPYSFLLTYKFSQDQIELLFNKIRRRSGWNNNPNVLQFKYALRQIIMRNSIEPSQTGNCTNFDTALCQPSGLLTFSWKRKQQDIEVRAVQPRALDIEAEKLLIDMDQQSPNAIKDNVLYYIAGFIVRHFMRTINCKKCKQELLLDPHDPMALKMESYPVYAKFTCWRQLGGLVMPSPAVMKVVKATEVIFKRRVIDTDLGINTERMLDLKIESAVMHQLGNSIFSNAADHYFDHEIGQEMDHLSYLTRAIVRKYVNLRLKTYGKRYSEYVVHGNVPSLRHQLTKTVLFSNQ